jgi:hypothetical protein
MKSVKNLAANRMMSVQS